MLVAGLIVVLDTRSDVKADRKSFASFGGNGSSRPSHGFDGPFQHFIAAVGHSSYRRCNRDRWPDTDSVEIRSVGEERPSPGP